MGLMETANLLSITEASRRGLSALVRMVEEGHEQVILRNHKPVAAIVRIERLEEMARLEDIWADLRDIALVEARMMTAGPQRFSLDEVLERFGFTREQLADLPDE